MGSAQRVRSDDARRRSVRCCAADAQGRTARLDTITNESADADRETIEAAGRLRVGMSVTTSVCEAAEAAIEVTRPRRVFNGAGS